MYQLVHNIRIYAKHVSTKKNGPADSLSRLRIWKFMRLMKHRVDDAPTKIPKQIWPIEKIWMD